MHKILGFVVVLASLVGNAQAITVIEISNPADGAGVGGAPTLNTAYEYQVTVSPGEDLIQFSVGATDISHVQNILGPGNGVAIDVTINAGSTRFTPYGGVNVDGAPDIAVVPYIIGWAPNVQQGVYYFGFDAPGSSVRDMGWTAAGISASPGNELWIADVGGGRGPVHGPGPSVPEPAAAMLGTLALAGAAGIRRRASSERAARS